MINKLHVMLLIVVRSPLTVKYRSRQYLPYSEVKSRFTRQRSQSFSRTDGPWFIESSKRKFPALTESCRLARAPNKDRRQSSVVLQYSRLMIIMMMLQYFSFRFSIDPQMILNLNLELSMGWMVNGETAGRPSLGVHVYILLTVSWMKCSRNGYPTTHNILRILNQRVYLSAGPNTDWGTAVL